MNRDFLKSLLQRFFQLLRRLKVKLTTTFRGRFFDKWAIPLLSDGINPKFSLVLVITPENFDLIQIKKSILSVVGQSYPRWELIIVTTIKSGSSCPDLSTYIDSLLVDQRVRLFQMDKPISTAINMAFEEANGGFSAILMAGDLLDIYALSAVCSCVNQYPQADLIYSDEDTIDPSGNFINPFFKPDWCPDSFLSHMYVGRLAVYRLTTLRQLGYCREDINAYQEYDLILRLSEKTAHIFHVPKLLYHARSIPNVNADLNFQQIQDIILDALERRNEPGRVIPASIPLYQTVRYEIREHRLISIIIPTRDLAEILDACLTSIFSKTTYFEYEVIVIDNGSRELQTFEVFDKWQKKEKRFSCHRLDIPFNYSKINNYAVQLAKGDSLVFLNNDIEVLTPDWLEAMYEQAQRESIGAVGALLLYPDNTVQHAGVIMGIRGLAAHSHVFFDADDSGYFGRIQAVGNYSAVTAACLMCRKEVFLSVGGFEESLAVAFNDVDLCLKMLEQGYRNIYLPHVRLYHYESKSRGREDTLEKQARFATEVEYMQKRWTSMIEHDPCYNVNLTLSNGSFDIRV